MRKTLRALARALRRAAKMAMLAIRAAGRLIGSPMPAEPGAELQSEFEDDLASACEDAALAGPTYADKCLVVHSYCTALAATTHDGVPPDPRSCLPLDVLTQREKRWLLSLTRTEAARVANAYSAIERHLSARRVDDQIAGVPSAVGLETREPDLQPGWEVHQAFEILLADERTLVAA